MKLNPDEKALHLAAAIVIIAILLALFVLNLIQTNLGTSPVSGFITDKRHYAASSPVYEWTPWVYELIITAQDGHAGYSVRVSEDVYNHVVLGSQVNRNRPFIQEE